MGNSNIFSLEQVYRRQLTKNWTDILDPFIYITSYTPETPASTGPTAGPAYGYSGGGGAGSFGARETGGTRVERIDFNNDTATSSPKGNLAHDHLDCAAFGNATHGYVIGDSFTTTNRSWISRVTYASDTSTASPRGNMSVPRGGNSSTGNASYAWISGQYDWMPSSAGQYASTVDRIDFSNDNTTSSARGNLDRAIARAGATGTANYGWWAGGSTAWNQTDTTSVSRIDYASDSSTASPKGTLSDPVESNTATGNIDYGYNIIGGGPGINGSTIVRYDYASDTGASTPKGKLSVQRYFLAGATGTQSYGYFMGGQDPSASPSNLQYKTTIDRVDYSNDTATASPKGNLDVNAAGPNDAGYRQAGGFSGQSNAFGASTAAIPASFVPATQYEPPLPPALPSGPAYGYSGGGGAGTFGTRETGGSKVQRIDFASDTSTTSVRGELKYDHLHGAAVGNTTHGYVTGDLFTTTARSYTSRVTYASDTSTALTRGMMTVARGGGSATGNASYAWISGAWDWIYGGAGPNASVVDRIDYSNDSATMSARGNLDRADGKIAASGNANYGWWMGGSGVTTVSRVDYGNDTATASPKGTLCATSYTNTAVGNVNYGYTTRGNPSYTDFLRYDYANDTGAPAPKGSLSFARNDFAGATGSQSYGYFMGGTSSPSTYHTSIDRIEYANDTATASPKGNLDTMIAGSSGWRRAGGFSGQSNAFGTQPVPSTAKLVDKGSDGYQTSSLGPAYGYLAGGSGISNVQRIDYASDTSTPTLKPNLPSEQSKGGGAGNLTHGYTFGGDAPSGSSTVYRLDYSNDAVAATTKGPLSTAGTYLNSVGNANFGYSGGRNTNTSIIDRLDYSNDTQAATSLGSIMSPGGVNGYSTTGNQSFGYFIGGLNPSGSARESTVRRLDYSNDAVATTPKGPLTGATQYSTATGNANYGYTFVGAGTAGTKIDRIEYANDTSTAVTKGSLTSPGYMRSATGSADYGYFCGGIPTYTKVDRIDYSNDTPTASAKGNLSIGTRHMQPFSAQQSGLFSQSYIPRMRFIDLTLEAAAIAPTPAGPAMGYLAGGMTPSVGTYTQVQRIDFASDTATAVQKGNLASEHAKGGGTGSNSYGYCLGGATPYPASTVQRSDYANDTETAATKGPLSAAGDYLASIGNINYGYTGGRLGSWPSHPNNFSILDRVDYSNDTATATVPNATGFSPGGNSYGGVGNQSYGYFAGGYDNPYGDHRSTVRRLDYSNDSATTSPKGPLNFKSANIAATGNANYGWTNNPPYGNNGSTINRIEYANDTATASPKGNLNHNRSKRAATGSADYGYFTGGASPNNTYVDRIDYANDTPTASPKGNLLYDVRSHQAFSAREYGLPQTPTSGTPALQSPYQPPFNFPVQLPTPGPAFAYFAGGSPGPGWNAFSGIDRIQYSNDTATASPKGALTASKYAMSGCGTKEYGYIGAGGQQPGPDFSTTDRIDYSNDTATALVRGSLNRAGRSTAAASNTTYGYWAGGMTPYPTPTSRVSRLTFASDTTVQVAKGNLTTVRRRWHATGNQSYGYFAGGSPGGTRIDRIDYTNDTPTAASKGPLSVTRSGHAASGNASFGYFINGFAPGTSTSVDRLDYSSDTTTASPKGPLTSARAYNTGTGSPNFGYVAGGWTPSGQISYTDRIEYSNDTATSSPKGTLNSNPYRNASVSSQAYGLPG